MKAGRTTFMQQKYMMPLHFSMRAFISLHSLTVFDDEFSSSINRMLRCFDNSLAWIFHALTCLHRFLDIHNEFEQAFHFPNYDRQMYGEEYSYRDSIANLDVFLKAVRLKEAHKIENHCNRIVGIDN